MGDGNPRIYLFTNEDINYKHNKRTNEKRRWHAWDYGNGIFSSTIHQNGQNHLNKNKIWCWLVIDMRNIEMSINEICKRLVPNLNKNKISVLDFFFFGGGAGGLDEILHTPEEVRILSFWMIRRWHVEEDIRHQEER